MFRLFTSPFLTKMATHILQHMASSGGRHPYARSQVLCTLCHCTFSNKGNLTRHQATCTGPTLPKASLGLKCERCDKHFAQKWNLGCHQRICTGPKVPVTTADLTCPKCGKLFSSKAYCVQHTSLCTGPKPASILACENCGKRFGDAWSCKRHQSTCTGPKLPLTGTELTCNKCGFLFTTAFSLNRHRRGCGVVYNCTKGCGATFTDKRAYRNHEKACTWRPRVLWCRVCGDRPGFYDEVHYAEHVAKHHAEDPELPSCAARPPPYTVSMGRYTCTACGEGHVTMAQFRLHCLKSHNGIVTAPKWNGVPERGDGPIGTVYDFETGTYVVVAEEETCSNDA